MRRPWLAAAVLLAWCASSSALPVDAVGGGGDDAVPADEALIHEHVEAVKRAVYRELAIMAGHEELDFDKVGVSPTGSAAMTGLESASGNVRGGDPIEDDVSPEEQAAEQAVEEQFGHSHIAVRRRMTVYESHSEIAARQHYRRRFPERVD